MQTMQAMLGFETSFFDTPANQAFVGPVTVIRYDGLVAELSVDLRSTTATQVGEQAAQQLGSTFDAEQAVLLGVGEPPVKELSVGMFVRLTGLVNEDSLNGQVGPITQVLAHEGRYHVATPTGVKSVQFENVVLTRVGTVVRSAAFSVDPHRALADVGIMPGSRILWLEQLNTDAKVRKTVKFERIASDEGGKILSAIKSQFFAMDIAGDRRVSAGELRSFLWNLKLSDPDFKQIHKRFAPQGNYLEMEDILFLLGRPHIKNPNVPVDALIYEAVVSILGRRTTAHIDRDLSKEDKGVGYGHACKAHCASYTTSLILQGIVFFNLIVLAGYGISDELNILHMNSNDLQIMGWVALGAYLIYLIHLGCCVKLTSAFAHELEGMEKIISLMLRPRHENPQFHWHVQCYHYRTVHYTVVVDGKTQHRTRQERVNTHSASTGGMIPSLDRTPDFVPLTEAQQTQIDTDLDLDLSESNYMTEYYRWCAFHRRDIHQDKSHTEDLPSRVKSCLAVWVARSKPCWMNQCLYWIANIFLFSCLFRWCVQARIGHQKYTYLKKCYNIPFKL
eukprot:gnl/MRDRNA2_/MRDRNA2_56667_c0_seq1.p1 gnl/MRDRNA2_/MRDRNA2_56667_c0~~gnl/MRDRNA2_/MRDRNA2_56667_c0_seq1.p1  ORF type:complete len:620 (+),score=78.87 gnl/MRDRNA2_/MRDRNA2_56667_c0_seq1:176-1861(+)